MDTNRKRKELGVYLVLYYILFIKAKKCEEYIDGAYTIGKTSEHQLSQLIQRDQKKNEEKI